MSKMTGFALLPKEARSAAAARGGLANGTKFALGDPRAAAAAAKALAAGYGLKEGDPRTKELGRLGGLKSAAMRAAKRASRLAEDNLN